VLGTDDVLGMSSIEGLHQLNAEAGTAREERRELGHGGQG
jgi:hypothetical protein